MTIAEYSERGYPLEMLAERIESTLMGYSYEESIECCNREELDRALDLVDAHFKTLKVGFPRSQYTSDEWRWFYRYHGEVHIQSNSDFVDQVYLSDIIDELVDEMKFDVEDDVPESDMPDIDMLLNFDS